MAVILNKLDPAQKEKEAKDLEKKYRDNQKRIEMWDRFKKTPYFKLVLAVFDEEIENVNKLDNLPMIKSAKDFQELGELVSINMSAIKALKKTRERLFNA